MKSKSLATIVGILALEFGGCSPTYIYQTPQTSPQQRQYSQPQQSIPQRSAPQTVIPRPYQTIDHYIEQKVELITNPKNKTFYIIFQSPLSYLGAFNKDKRSEVANEIGNAELSVYRIIESLHLNKGLQLVAVEGQMYDDFFDIESPNELFQTNREIFNNLGRGDDYIKELLSLYIQHSTEINPIGGAKLSSWVYPELFGVGFETSSTLVTRQKLLDVSKFLEDLELRFFQAVTVADTYSKELYNSGRIKNSNVALVIDHIFLTYVNDLIKKAVEQGLNYNFIVIVPKGIPTSLDKRGTTSKQPLKIY